MDRIMTAAGASAFAILLLFASHPRTRLTQKTDYSWDGHSRTGLKRITARNPFNPIPFMRVGHVFNVWTTRKFREEKVLKREFAKAPFFWEVWYGRKTWSEALYTAQPVDCK